ncbi:MAG: hypothetical protein JNK61_07610 [Bacteroidia bacterium]|nr:hypothetical protein [Bacteroidia bacterium]HQV01283.1 hypothetical protein [Bacteroidia bacterium]
MSSEHIQAIHDIRNIMQRSSRFISLSGLSGVFAGVYALCGAAAAYLYTSLEYSQGPYWAAARDSVGNINMGWYTFFFANACTVLLLSVITAFVFTYRKSRKQGLPIWDYTAKRLIINMAIPLVAGGVFILIIFWHYHLAGLVAPAMLLFYGLALLNAGKYTLVEIRYLGITQIVIGLIATYDIGHGLFYWALGFGVCHIVYGSWMWFKYEKHIK